MTDAQVLLSSEECASNTEQFGQKNDATVKDAQVLLKREEFALSMVPRSNHAVLKDAQIKLSEEEYAGGTCFSIIFWIRF